MAKKLTTDNLPAIFGAVKDYVDKKTGEDTPADVATEADIEAAVEEIFGALDME